MANRRYFRNLGNGAVFPCAVCGRKTRETDTGGTGICMECYEIAGYDNMVNDNRYGPETKEYKDARAECERMLAAVVTKGGDAAKVKALNEFIWEE
jgi:hypothetical protein